MSAVILEHNKIPQMLPLEACKRISVFVGTDKKCFASNEKGIVTFALEPYKNISRKATHLLPQILETYTKNGIKNVEQLIDLAALELRSGAKPIRCIKLYKVPLSPPDIAKISEKFSSVHDLRIEHCKFSANRHFVEALHQFQSLRSLQIILDAEEIDEKDSVAFQEHLVSQLPKGCTVTLCAKPQTRFSLCSFLSGLFCKKK